MVKDLVRALLPKGGFARSVAILAGGTVAAQAVTAIAAPLLTRLYRPEEFGLLAAYAAILTVVGAVAALRYEMAILLPEPDDEPVAANLLAVSLLLTLATSLLTALVFPWLLRLRLLGAALESLWPYVWVLPIGLMGAGFTLALSNWAIRLRAFSHVSSTKVAQLSVQSGAQVALGFLPIGPLGLLLGDALGRIAGLSALCRLAWQRSQAALRSISLEGMRQAARRYRRFPLFASWAALITAFSLQLPFLLMQAWYGAQVLGWFSLANRVIVLPLLLIGQGVSQAYMGEAARLAVQDPPALRRLYLHCAQRLFLAALLPMAVLLLFGPELFALVFGEAWREAGLYARLMSLMLLTFFVAWPLSATSNVLEQQGLQLAWDVGRLVALSLGLGLCRWLHAPPLWAVLAYSVLHLIGYLALFLLDYWMIQERVRAHEAAGQMTAGP